MANTPKKYDRHVKEDKTNGHAPGKITCDAADQKPGQCNQVEANVGTLNDSAGSLILLIPRDFFCPSVEVSYGDRQH